MRISPLLIVVAALNPATCATRTLLLGDAERGKLLFQSLRCILCHSVNGVGGTTAPDLGRDRDRGFSPYDMAALMWNHAPKMWKAMARRGVARPTLDEQQAADLFVFFYAARYFEAPGNTRRGAQLFRIRRCGQCHGIETSVRAGIKPVREWDSLWDPITLAQQMWSHSKDAMYALDRPEVLYQPLSAQELIDLLYWIRSARHEGHTAGFAPASPESGRELLLSKGCTGCHRGALTLEAHRTRYGLTDFAAALWSHPLRAGQTRTLLNQEEMRRLVGYLIATQFFDERGDPAHGERVFKKKRCGVCHDNPSSGAPGRTTMAGRMTSLGLVAALWKHGPEMMHRMRRQKIAWPHFAGSEMADLSAYLHGLEFKRRILGAASKQNRAATPISPLRGLTKGRSTSRSRVTIGAETGELAWLRSVAAEPLAGRNFPPGGSCHGVDVRNGG